MRKLFSTKKRIVATVGTVALVAAMAGGAFAYFTASGTGTGTAYVGAGSNFTVTVGATSGYLYPDYPVGVGPNIESFPITVTNNSAGNVMLSTVTISLDQNTLNAGCPVGWFSIDGTSPTGSDVQTPAMNLVSGGTWTFGATVELIDNNTPQNACEGSVATLVVTASS